MSGKGSPRCRWRCPGGTSRQTRPQRGPLPKLPNPPAAAVAAPAAAGSHPWELLAFLGREGQAGVHTREYTTITTHTHSGGGGILQEIRSQVTIFGGQLCLRPGHAQRGSPRPPQRWAPVLGAVPARRAPGASWSPEGFAAPSQTPAPPPPISKRKKKKTTIGPERTERFIGRRTNPARSPAVRPGCDALIS